MLLILVPLRLICYYLIAINVFSIVELKRQTRMKKAGKYEETVETFESLVSVNLFAINGSDGLSPESVVL